MALHNKIPSGWGVPKVESAVTKVDHNDMMLSKQIDLS